LFCNSREYKAKNDGKNNRQAEGVGRGEYERDSWRLWRRRNENAAVEEYLLSSNYDIID